MMTMYRVVTDRRNSLSADSTAGPTDEPVTGMMLPEGLWVVGCPEPGMERNGLVLSVEDIGDMGQK